MTYAAASEIESSRFGAFHRLVIVLVGLTVVFDGYDTFVPAYVIKYVVKPWHLLPSQAGLLVSSGLIGFMIGSLVHGSVADRIGRRATFLGGMWISGIFSLATAIFARDDGTFLALRFLTGLGLGTLLPLATTYVTEFAPARNRNAFVVWGAAVGWATGAVVAALVGIFLTPRFGWHALFWFASLSLLVTVAAQFVLPESPRYLALRARFTELAVLLGRIRPDRAAAYREATFAIPHAPAHAGSPLALLAPEYRRNTIVIWVCAFLILFDIYGLSGWLPTIMAARGEGFATSFGYGALLQFMSLLGAFACGAIADRRGSRKGPLLTWWVVGGIAVLLLALLNTHVTNFVLIAAAGFFVIGGQFILNNFTAVAYATELRATGVGMELGVGRLGAILGPFIGGVLQEHFHGAGSFFAAMAAAALLSAAAISFSRPVQGDIASAPTMPQDAVAS
ncbi:MAG TPA: MFS transporter [Candidatus Baltobacteraceae bacterium]|nr:MFS transporter [Candidatus Baltobacteraceae bacterium]